MVVVKAQRRVSARIQEKQREEKQREEKLRLVKRRVNLLTDEIIGNNGAAVDDGDVDDVEKSTINAFSKSNKRGRKVKDAENVEREEEVEEEKLEKGKVSVESTSSGAELVDGNVVNFAEKSDHAKVKETLRLFNKYYLQGVQVCRFILANRYNNTFIELFEFFFNVFVFFFYLIVQSTD